MCFQRSFRNNFQVFTEFLNIEFLIYLGTMMTGRWLGWEKDDLFISWRPAISWNWEREIYSFIQNILQILQKASGQFKTSSLETFIHGKSIYTSSSKQSRSWMSKQISSRQHDHPHNKRFYRLLHPSWSWVKLPSLMINLSGAIKGKILWVLLQFALSMVDSVCLVVPYPFLLCSYSLCAGRLGCMILVHCVTFGDL